MARLGATLVFFLWAVAAHAQVWRGDVRDDGHFVTGTVSVGLEAEVMCRGPSQGGARSFEAGDYETRPLAQGHWRLSFGTALMPYSPSEQSDGVVLWLDGVGYRLPTVTWSELDGVWAVDLPAQDQVFQKLTQARAFVLQTGPATAWTMPLGGFGAAMMTAGAACDAAWAAAGATGVPSPQLARAKAAVQRGCDGASYTAQPTAFLSGLIDGDEVPDVAVWWGDISCNQALARPFCGASHCSFDVYLSGKAEPDQWLAMAAALTPLNNGRVGVDLVARQSVCGEDSLGCRVIWYWTPQGFQPQVMPDQ